MSLLRSKISQLREYKKRRKQKISCKNMKPALLYLRKYIDENYQHNRVNRQEDKENIGKTLKKFSQETIFKEKKVHECVNTKVKEFYFKPTKFVNGFRLKQKIMSQTTKTDYQLNGMRVEAPPKQTQRSSAEVKPKKLKKTIISNIGESSPTQSEVQHNEKVIKYIPTQKQVRFVVSPPIENTPYFGTPSSGLQSPEETANKSQHKIEAIEQQEAPIEELDHVINSQIKPQQAPEFIKSEHFKISSKSMKKLGYNTLFDYLNEMKKYNSINKKQVKEAFYYPLACMVPQNNQSLQYELINKREKTIFHQKLSKFQKEITVHDDFSGKKVELKNFNNKNSRYLTKPKSNFSKAQTPTQNKPLTDEMVEKKSKKFLLEYEQIVMCNCANKKYFSYQLSSDTDYNSFLRFTAPLLDSKPQKDNNYLIENKDSDSLGLYFCCLINSSLGVRQGFFWIGKPIQYYRKDQIIKVIDDFLFDVGAFGIFQSDRLWIVGNHGRNSHIMKSLLKRCNGQRNSQKSNSQKPKKCRISKRVSLSISQQPHTETPEIFMGLLTNFSQFNQGMFIKKQRNNVSTRGVFKLVYQPTENYYEKKKTNYQSDF